MRKEIKYVLDKNIFKIFAVCIFFICFFLSDNIYAKGLRFKAVSIKDSKNNEDFLEHSFRFVTGAQSSAKAREIWTAGTNTKVEVGGGQVYGAGQSLGSGWLDDQYILSKSFKK